MREPYRPLLKYLSVSKLTCYELARKMAKYGNYYPQKLYAWAKGTSRPNIEDLGPMRKAQKRSFTEYYREIDNMHYEIERTKND